MKIQKSYHFVHVSLLLYEHYEKGWMFLNDNYCIRNRMDDGLECEIDGRADG